MNRIIAIIPARGGSKGIPRKALQLLGDKPLIAYTIRDALSISGVTKVFVNTDDPEIQSVSIECGAEVPFLRPPGLAKDDSKLEDALRYSSTWYREQEGFVPDIEIIMSPTHPFRRSDLINNSLKLGLENTDIFNLGSISPAKVTLENYWIRNNVSVERFSFPINTVSAPETLYQSAFSFNIVFSCRSSYLPDKRLPCILNEIESIDIDEPEDLEVARMVVSEGLYPFNENN